MRLALALLFLLAFSSFAHASEIRAFEVCVTNASHFLISVAPDDEESDGNLPESVIIPIGQERCLLIRGGKFRVIGIFSAEDMKIVQRPDPTKFVLAPIRGVKSRLEIHDQNFLCKTVSCRKYIERASARR